jgi:hypothetical protein
VTFATSHITLRIAAQIDSDPETLLSGSHARDIRELPKENPMADYLRGTVLWHIDGFADGRSDRVCKYLCCLR